MLEVKNSIMSAYFGYNSNYRTRPKVLICSVSYFQTPVTEHDHDLESLTNSGCGSPKQKNSSRRNAWGNQSYADLITQAIKSTPEQRLTLSQIYDWVVKNVPYFKDKGDSASSSGWKVISFLVFYR